MDLLGEGVGGRGGEEGKGRGRREGGKEVAQALNGLRIAGGSELVNLFANLAGELANLLARLSLCLSLCSERRRD